MAKKRKLKKKKLLKFVITVIIILLGISFLTDVKINNVVVKGNILYSDYEIIEKAGLSNYPSSLKTFSTSIRKKLLKDSYIKKVKVQRKGLKKVIIDVDENLPLFYYLPAEKTILTDKTEVDDNFPVPTVINYVPDKIYEMLLNEIADLNYDIVKRISEIKYDPNEVDDERFLFTMNDGNYVYLTLERFDKVDKYLEIIKSFDNKKGILYLDSGEYFEVKG
ncbi:MAG: FtsQ-type POTRA domain-containing protein [Bacilli bacterium]|nr:FtsQ-type POTRA domain-containing protein [Bacilli bacterium]